MPESVIWVFLLVGLVAMLPPFIPAVVVLHRFGRSVGLDFGYDGGRLAAGPQVETLLSGLVWRLNQALGLFLASAALTSILMRHGPVLSQSDVKSLVVAVLAAAGIIGPYLVLRQFLRPITGHQPGTLRPAVSPEAYLGPVRRVVPWLVAACGLAVPVGAVALSMTASYDGYKIYWEGLLIVPLVSVGVVLATEVESLGVRDKLTDPALVYLWDALRARSLRVLTAVAVFGVALSYDMAAGGLVGVALVAPFPAAASLQAVAVTLAFFFKVTAFVLVVTPVGRFRAELWPGLEPGARLRWGATTEETTSS